MQMILTNCCPGGRTRYEVWLYSLINLRAGEVQWRNAIEDGTRCGTGSLARSVGAARSRSRSRPRGDRWWSMHLVLILLPAAVPRRHASARAHAAWLLRLTARISPTFFFWCHQIDREMLFLFNLIRMGVDGSFLVQHCCCCCRRLTDYCFGTFRFSQNSRKLFFPLFPRDVSAGRPLH